MSTLAEQFHDSFDAYYAGKKTGWTAQKPVAQPVAKKPDESQQHVAGEKLPVESRH